MMKTIFLSTAYIVISAGLINFNKFLVHEGRFPHAMALTSIHMMVSWLGASLLYVCCPTLFPAMPKCEGRKTEVIKYFVPLGLMFAVSLFSSNQAYLYCTVAFLQFMKEANIVLVFVLSCLGGLQVADRSKVLVLCWILAGSLLAVQGEIHFVLFGFLIQGLSQFAECGKNVFGEWILSKSELRLDPLTYTMFMAPMALMVLLTGLLFTGHMQMFQDFLVWWPYLIPNGMLAFVLNVTIAKLIKDCSTVTFILAGLIKDMFIVSTSALVFGDPISMQQIIGFMACLCGIAAWSKLKLDPIAHKAMQHALGATPVQPPEKEFGSSEEKEPIAQFGVRPSAQNKV